MKVAVTANGVDLDAAISSVFGRCSTYILVDTETMQFEALDNPALGAPSGAGIQAAQFVIERGAQAVLTGNVGPKAFGVFRAAHVPVFLLGNETVHNALGAYKKGLLQSTGGASVAAHRGMRSGGMGRERGTSHQN